MRNFAFVCLFLCLVAFGTLPASAGVFVSSPGNGASVQSPVHFVATGQSPNCKKGVSSVGIFTAPNVLAKSSSGTHIDTYLTLSPGTYNVTVQEKDNCGWSASKTVKIKVGSADTGGSGSTVGGATLSALQSQNGWTGYALLPPLYLICPDCKADGPRAKWGISQKVKSPSLSGSATKYDIGGKMLFADVLYNKHLIGDFSSNGMADKARTLVPTLHEFTYDVYFWVDNAEISQALEFDINQSFGDHRYVWGHECRIAGGHQWDTWDNTKMHWVPSGIPCKPKSKAWNHLILKGKRTSDNHLVFQSVTLNGVTNKFNRTDVPKYTKNWYGVSIAFQMDLNVKTQPYSVYLDKLSFTYK